VSAASRRSFLKGGAVAAAPLALAAASSAVAADAQKARLARLEDEAAIRELHQAWLRKVNAEGHGEVRRLRPDPEAAADVVEVSADGLSARGRFHLAAEIEALLPKDCTLAQMAHAQGEGIVRRSEPRLVRADYAKAQGAWAIAKIEVAKA
jgi:hypothetical protein